MLISQKRLYTYKEVNNIPINFHQLLLIKDAKNYRNPSVTFLVPKNAIQNLNHLQIRKKSRANLRLFKHGQTFLSQIRDSFQNTRLGLINLGL